MPVLKYNTASEIKAEAKLSNNVFKPDEVEQAGEDFEIIVENFTDKDRTTSPQQVWLSTDREYPIIKSAARIGAAGLLLTKFADSVEAGEKKINLAYKMLKNLVYGEESGTGGGDASAQKGDVIMEGGSFENATMEKLINEDLNDDLTVG